MIELLRLIDLLLELYMYILLAAAVLSWLIVLDVVSISHQAVAIIADFLYRITEPLLQPIRKRLPNFGGIDISFIVLVLIIIFIRVVIIPNLIKAFI